jgi:hypothetical protein
MFERGAHGIRNQEKLEILFIDRMRRSQMSKQILKRAPVLGTYQHDRKVRDLSGLNQRQCLEELVERAKPTGEPDECIRVLEEEDPSDEEVSTRDGVVEIRVWQLLVGELDIAPHRPASGLACAPVHCFHETRAATGHRGESKLGHAPAHFTSHLVQRMRLAVARRTEHGYARPNEVECSESLDEVGKGSQDKPQLPPT